MMQNLIKIIWRNVDRKTKLYFFLLLLGMVLASISEAASISIALPYIAVLINPENAIKSLGNSNLFNWLLFDKSDIFFNLTIIFCVAVTLSGFLRIVVMQMATNFSFKTGEILSNKAYKSIVEADYEFLISKNSGELINLASIKPDNLIYGFITPCLTLCSSLAFSIFIVLVLCYVNIWMTLGSILFFCILYALIIKQNKKNLIQISLSISEIRDNLVRLVQHTVGGIRDIIINNMSVNYIKEYEKENALIRSSQAKSIIIGTSPRYYVETISLFFLAIVGYIIISREGSAEYISIVAVFALAAQKLLPLAQQSYNSWSTIKTNYDSALDVLSAFSYPKEEVAEEKNRIPFREKVDLSNISISLSGKKIIRNFSLTINKGEKIGLVGESGSGKTTLIDFMMGLTTCDDGIFSVDGSQISDEERVLWRRQTSHVPQNVFLFNQSILLNVVLGDTSPNLNFAYECLALAQLKEFVMNLPNGINTVVGDGGLQISGGQRQRIGIARALYKGSDILFLDEATSALDSNTELSIMKSLYALDKVTMIIVAHRENTLAGCNRIVHVG